MTRAASNPFVLGAISAMLALFASCYGQTSLASKHGDELRATHLRTEYHQNPIGIEVHAPRLSWRLQSESRGVKQAAYQLRIAEDPSQLREGTHLFFDSGKVATDQSNQLVYGGPPLQFRQRYHWQVRVWDARGRVSAWSEPAYWEMGLPPGSAWQARWIEPRIDEDLDSSNPAPMLRAEFELEGRIVRARAYVTSLGLYEVYLNGTRVGNQLFTPGWTNYTRRLQYQTYDVTGLLKRGRNAAGALLGDGWYRGRIRHENKRRYFGDRLALLMQIEVTYADGRVQTVATDGAWKATTGPILLSDIYDGEIYDARLERDGWTEAGYDDSAWRGVTLIDPPQAALIAPVGPPVRRIEELRPTRIFKTPTGLTVADMGQNMVGWVRMRVQGPAGTTVTLRHAELIDPQGNFYTDNLRGALQQIRYTLKGKGEETFEPHFTFHGFRYVAIEGYPGEVRPDSLTGIVVHSDMAPTGEFATSNALLNQLQHNIYWSQKGNFLEVPTDCPQRAERFGWTGDGQLFSPTAAFNMDVAGFFTKWLGDLASEQTAQGAVTVTVPDVLIRAPAPNNVPAGVAAGPGGWGDAATIIPWNLYLAYGDVGILRSQYSSMKRWVEYERDRAGPDFIWSDDFQFGDWLDLLVLDKRDLRDDIGHTSSELTATAYFARSTDILRRSAKLLGKTEDEAFYTNLFSSIQAAFQAKFVAADGRVGEGTQTAYVLALDFDLLPESLRPAAARKLAEEVRTRGRITTGLLGTPRLLHGLSRFGYFEEAYRLLTRQEFPSWLYPVTRGATTIWERWDGIRPDGSLQDGGRNSFNHYALGAVGEWMYRVIAGINLDPSAPGYKHSIIEPVPGGGITWAKGSLETLYGRLSSSWQLHDGQFVLEIQVPPNTRATVRLPHARLTEVREGGRLLKDVVGIASPRQEDGQEGGREQGSVAVEVGSGRYRFSHPWNRNE